MMLPELANVIIIARVHLRITKKEFILSFVRVVQELFAALRVDELASKVSDKIRIIRFKLLNVQFQSVLSTQN